jgi:hypothetical protein
LSLLSMKQPGDLKFVVGSDSIPRSERMSAAEKADVELCGATGRSLPASTDQVAPGEQQVCNNCGPSGPRGKYCNESILACVKPDDYCGAIFINYCRYVT